MKRITRDEMFAEIVLIIAKRCTCPRPEEIMGRVGAILVQQGRIISTGYAGSPKGLDHCQDAGCSMLDGHCVRTIHAEANAIAFAAKFGAKTDGAVMYCTLAPCLNCAKLIINSGITEVVYLHRYSSDDGLHILQMVGIGVRLYEMY